MAFDGLVAALAVKRRRPGKEGPEVIIDGSHRSHSRAGGHDRRGPLDGHPGKHSLDFVGVGSIQPLEELAGIRREGLHVPAVPLGIEDIKSEGGLSGTGYSGHHGYCADRYLDGDPFEVVLPCSLNPDWTDRHAC